jgi:hypothetical protein
MIYCVAMIFVCSSEPTSILVHFYCVHSVLVKTSFACCYSLILLFFLSILKNKRGTRFTPMFQWPDKSLSLGVTQALAWKRSGLMVRPSVQVR